MARLGKGSLGNQGQIVIKRAYREGVNKFFDSIWVTKPKDACKGKEVLLKEGVSVWNDSTRELSKEMTSIALGSYSDNSVNREGARSGSSVVEESLMDANA